MAQPVHLYLDLNGEPIDPEQGEATADSFDFTTGNEAEQSALILPAVQQASLSNRWHPKKTGDGAADAFGTEADEDDAALILPAVQTVREAARRTTCDSTEGEDPPLTFDGGDVF